MFALIHVGHLNLNGLPQLIVSHGTALSEFDMFFI